MKRIYQYLFIIGALLAGGLFTTSCSDMEKVFEPTLYEYSEITIDDFTPKTGRPGEQITITGTNFGEYSDAATITINGIIASDFVSYADNQMVVRVPQDAGSGILAVKVWTYEKAFSDTFTFIPGAKISGISPEEAPVGAQVTIKGENFGTDASAVTVKFGGDVEAEIVSITETEIVVTVPDGGIRGAITLELGPQVLTGPVFSYPFVGLNFEFNTDGDSEGWVTSHNSTIEVSRRNNECFLRYECK